MTTPNNTVAGLAEKLLPCPFCGTTRHIDVEPWFGESPEGTSIQCFADDCPANPSVEEATRAEAIAAWNRRASPAPSAGVVDDAMEKRAMRGFWKEVEASGCEPPAWPYARDTLTPRWVRAALNAALSGVSAPVGVIGDAIRHLSKWLDCNECECESGHQCGRTEVERTRDQLRALTPPAAAPRVEEPDRVSGEHVQNLVEFARNAPRTYRDHDEPPPTDFTTPAASEDGLPGKLRCLDAPACECDHPTGWQCLKCAREDAKRLAQRLEAEDTNDTDCIEAAALIRRLAASGQEKA